MKLFCCRKSFGCSCLVVICIFICIRRVSCYFIILTCDIKSCNPNDSLNKFFALIFWAPIFLHPKAVITVNNSLHQGFIIISIKIKEAIEIGEILKSWNKVRILNWGVYPNSIKSFSIPRNKLLVNIDYTILGNRIAIAFIQIHNIYQLGKLLKNFKFGWGDTQCGFISISQNYEVYGLSVKCFGCPNFLFIVIFISWLRNYEAMIRIP